MDLFSSIKKRVPFDVYRSFATLHSLPSGRGFDGCIGAISQIPVPEDREFAIDLLDSMYKESILHCEKSLLIYEGESEDFEALRAVLPDVEIPESDYSKQYPHYLDYDDLLGVDETPVLVHKTQVDDDWYLVYASKRFFTERVEVSLESINEEFQERLKDFQEILAIKKNYRQFFDVVKIPASGNHLELRIDSPGKISKAEADRASEAMKGALDALFGFALVGSASNLRPVNFFPLIKKLYDSNEGRVCELSFTTDGGGVKTSKMRRYEDDQRSETYHKEGSKHAVVTPYKIGVRWLLKRGKETQVNPELYIAGRHSQLSSPTPPVVSSVSISKCLDESDYNFVRDVIRRYL